jgi:hypothetical protein
MLAFDQTPTLSTAYAEKQGREETTIGNLDKRAPTFEGTLFIGFRGQVPLLQRQIDRTSTAEELRASEGRPTGQHDQDENDAVLKARDLRLELLARKYEDEASIEDMARLRILTERLRKLAPRVTDKDVEQLADMVADAEGIAARLAAVKEKFGLR